MSWRCDICDSYNEEKSTVCYVCGQARSEASIREGKRRARLERNQRITVAVYSKGALGAKIACYGTVVTAAVVIAVALIRLLAQDRIGDVVHNLVQMVRHTGDTLADGALPNLRALGQHLGELSLEDLTRNVQDIFAGAKNRLQMGSMNCNTVSARWGDNLETGMENVEPVLTVLHSRMRHKVLFLAEIYQTVTQRVRSYF